ncbi:hypothetical protein [Larkinella soli]|uniref:hypothetical protein n=1 Tax=Larkinella soli TaxID=1770527 RepID=UPI000FFC0EBF|nr:hypothetical protein [Larkinella soli]
MKNFTEVAIKDNVRFRFSDTLSGESNINPAKNPLNWEAIEWEEAEHIVEIKFEKGTLLKAMIDENKEKCLAVYERSKTYPIPKNGVIYNSDGSLFKILEPPVLVGNIALSISENIKGNGFGGLYPTWLSNSKGDKVIGISIMFPPKYRNRYGDFFEVRELDLETGEFGEVLQEGAI